MLESLRKAYRENRSLVESRRDDSKQEAVDPKVVKSLGDLQDLAMSLQKGLIETDARDVPALLSNIESLTRIVADVHNSLMRMSTTYKRSGDRPR